MSFQYPASFSSSAGGVAYSVPGTCTPATSRTIVICDSALDISYRSIASVSARRTRLSSKGFLSWLSAIQLVQSHELSWKRTRSPRAFWSCSFSPGVMVRNWVTARSPRMAAICAAEDFTKVARKPSR